MHRAHDVVVVGHGGLGDRARDAEIRHLDISVGHDEDVVRLDVAVHEIVRMRLCQCTGNLFCYVECLCHRQRALFLDAFLQRTPRHILHDDVVTPFGDTDIVDIDDVGMRNARGSLCLALEASDELRVVLILLVQDFYGNRALQELIFRPIDICHAAAAYEHLQCVASIQDTLDHVCSSYRLCL